MNVVLMTSEKHEFGFHFKSTHGSRSKPQHNDRNPSEVEVELRILRNNFERLEGLYKDALEENNSIKSDYESKLISADETNTRLIGQKEVLE